MKRVFLNYLVIAALSVVAALMSCSNEKIQLPESTTYSDGRTERYEYDNENRIAKILYCDKSGTMTYSYAITYSGDNFIKSVLTTGFDSAFVATVEYSKSGNKITVTIKSNNRDSIDTAIVDLDNDGFPTKYEAITDVVSSVGVYEIHSGNLTKHSYKVVRVGAMTLEGSDDCKYDNKKSPFFQCKTPKWWWILSDKCMSTQNNVIERSKNSGEKIEYKYEFDNAGYPTKCTAKYNNGESVNEFKYKRLNAST